LAHQHTTLAAEAAVPIQQEMRLTVAQAAAVLAAVLVAHLAYQLRDLPIQVAAVAAVLV